MIDDWRRAVLTIGCVGAIALSWQAIQTGSAPARSPRETGSLRRWSTLEVRVLRPPGSDREPCEVLWLPGDTSGGGGDADATPIRKLTNEADIVVFKNVDVGNVEIRACTMDGGWKGGSAVVLEADRPGKLEVVLERTLTVSGTLVDSNRKPIGEGVVLVAMDKFGEPFFPSPQHREQGRVTDAQGRFEIPNVPSGKIHLLAMALGKAPALIESVAGQAKDVPITLHSGATIAVTVRRAGQPVGDVDVGLVVPRPASPDADEIAFRAQVRLLGNYEGSPQRTSRDGTATFTGVPRGAWAVAARTRSVAGPPKDLVRPVNGFVLIGESLQVADEGKSTVTIELP